MPFHPAVIDLKAALEQPVQPLCDIAEDGVCETLDCCESPPRREWRGMTEEEKRECAQAMDAEPLAEGWPELVKFARAIEAALKEKNDG